MLPLFNIFSPQKYGLLLISGLTVDYGMIAIQLHFILKIINSSFV